MNSSLKGSFVVVSLSFTIGLLVLIFLIFHFERLEGRVEAVEAQVAELAGQTETLQKKISRELPTLMVHCARRAVNGPSGVPFAHPMVEVSGLVEKRNLWTEIVVIDEGMEASYLVSYAGGPTTNYKTVWDGYIQSIRGQGGYHILSPDAQYVLRGWRHPYTEDTPEFEVDELVFEDSFEIPSCD